MIGQLSTDMVTNPPTLTLCLVDLTGETVFQITYNLSLSSLLLLQRRLVVEKSIYALFFFLLVQDQGLRNQILLSVLVPTVTGLGMDSEDILKE